MGRRLIPKFLPQEFVYAQINFRPIVIDDAQVRVQRGRELLVAEPRLNDFPRFCIAAGTFRVIEPCGEGMPRVMKGMCCLRRLIECAALRIGLCDAVG